ncbi:NAD(P)/FAD-dependent oxidoreductase [Nocardia arizonensis]|uniref:NAD(P)/FAD-dependent oxidoreductase n=1 Tax=Nocardia arizonensis TaxID=1141647 RepID=UPI0006D29071|nr:NAD(P)/FAD-dependent oxidoreductase [Nocardia arizonensis]
MTEQLEQSYDVVVVGGGAAGLNGALMLARSRRSVAVIDAGQPRNAPAGGVHGLLGHDGVPPAELLARGRAEVREYGGHIVEGAVTDLHRDDSGFRVSLADGTRVHARRVLVTSGLVDELPDIPGVREQWGRGVVHCPYCHGWEVRDKAIGVLGSGPMSVHQALLFRQLSPDVVYVTHTVAPTPEQAEQLAARGIRVIESKAEGLETEGDRLVGVRLGDGTVLDRDAVVVSTRMVARADFLGSVGLTTVDHPSGAGVHLPTDALGRTEVAGIWAAGNVTDPSAQVGASAAAGAAAGAQINFDLVNEEIRAAVEARGAGSAAPG